MMGLFGGTTARNITQLRRALRARMRLLLFLGGVGLLTTAIPLIVVFGFRVDIPGQRLGVYTGIGCGLAAIAAIGWLRGIWLLRHDTRLQEYRLSCKDERLQSINGKALQIAAGVLLAAIYAVCLIGGLFEPLLIKILLILAAVFALTYAISYIIVEKRS